MTLDGKIFYFTSAAYHWAAIKRTYNMGDENNKTTGIGE
jgi:hypothetical protein